VAVSHYLVRSDDDADFLDQLRHAARVKHYAP
jgi:TetR/AcrR family transcriptional regulator, repressor for uid operon